MTPIAEQVKHTGPLPHVSIGTLAPSLYLNESWQLAASLWREVHLDLITPLDQVDPSPVR